MVSADFGFTGFLLRFDLLIIPGRKLKVTHAGLALCGITLLSSCGIYRQNVVNVPLFENKGDTQAGAHAGFTGLDAQACFAPTGNIAVLANYSDMGTRRESFSAVNYTIEKHRFFEFGGGYFRKNSNGFVSEFFFLAGQSRGSRYNQGLDSARQVYRMQRNASYNRFCVQADFGKAHGNWKFAVSPRLMVVDYFHVEDNSTGGYKEGPRTFVYSDLAATVQYRFHKHFMVSAQVSCTFPVKGRHTGYYGFSPYNASVGIIGVFSFKKDKHAE